jgi:DNA modification methylase
MLIQADARSLPLADESVDCCVTSPPYFGLRDYGDARQIGLGVSIDEYAEDLGTVFDEVRRVLKPAGTVWLNLGDSYAMDAKWGGVCGWRHSPAEASGQAAYRQRRVTGLKPKDLIGIPWHVAFALRGRGWYLRSDIVWAKPNQMPESVKDRPTKAHEYLFLLTKSERYYFNADAIAEPVSAAMLAEVEQGYEGLGLKDYEAAGVQNPSSVKARIIANARRKNEQSGDRRKVGFNDRHDDAACFRRNKRTVWTVNTQPYAGAHFATMPEKLVEPCILAGCPFGGLVLDPFVGSGTVVAVAERLGRRGVGVDLSYQDLAKERTRQRGLRFA